jgi:hypothetical protein
MSVNKSQDNANILLGNQTHLLLSSEPVTETISLTKESHTSILKSNVYNHADQSFLSQLEKEVVLTTITWGVADTEEQLLLTLKLPEIFETNNINPHRSFLNNYTFYNADFELGFMLNGTPFHQGRLIVCAIPTLEFASHTFRKTQMPSVQLSPTMNSASNVRLCLNWMSVYGMGSTYNDPFFSQPAFYVQVQVLNSLRTSADSAQSLELTITCKLKNAHVVNPTFNHPFLSLSGKDQESGVSSNFNPLPRENTVFTAQSGILDLGASLLDSLIPGTGAIVHAVVPFLGSLDHPSQNNNKDSNLNEASDVTHFSGGVNSIRLNQSQGIFSPVRPQDIPGTRDEMAILDICKIPSIYERTYWSVIRDSGYVLHARSICPTYFAYTFKRPNDTLVRPSALAGVASNFAFWRGSLDIRIDIVKSAFHKGRLIVGFVPGVFRNDFTLAEITANPNWIIDVTETSSFNLNVPYGANTEWRHMALYPFVTSNPASAISATGTFVIMVLNKLVFSSGLTPTVDLNLYISAGDDFELAYPHPLHVFNNDDNAVPAPTQKIFIPQSGSQQVDTTTVRETAGSDGLFESANQSVPFLTSVKSISDLMKKPYYYETVILPANEGITQEAYIPNTISVPSKVTNAFDMFSSMFRFQHGPMRFFGAMPTNKALSRRLLYFSSHYDPSHTIINLTSIPFNVNQLSSITNTYFHISNVTNPFFDVTLPWLSIYPKIMILQTSDLTVMPIGGSGTLRIIQDSLTSDLDLASHIRVFRSFADETVMSYFIGSGPRTYSDVI